MFWQRCIIKLEKTDRQKDRKTERQKADIKLVFEQQKDIKKGALI